MKCWLLCCAAALAALAGEPRWGGELRFSIYAEPKTFHPLLVADQASDAVRYLTGGVLVRFNRATLEMEPELAETWTLAAGGRELRFQLRRDLHFSDGSPLTAADAAFTLRTLFDPKTDSPDAEAFGPARGKIAVEARGPQTLTVRLPAPIAGVERLFGSVPMVSPRALDEAANPAAMPVAGAFRVAEYRRGVRVVLARNPYYWKTSAGRRLPYLDGIRLEIQQNRALELSRFLAGDLDLINNVDPEAFARLCGRPGVAAVDAGPSLDTEQMWFNQAPSAPIPAYKKAWFASREFRRAISAAINRADLCRLVYQNRAVPARGIVPVSNRTWANTRLPAPAFDAAEARRLLAAAGFRMDGAQLVDRARHPVEFSLVTNAGNAGRERMAALIQEDLARLGIKVRVAALDFRSLIERITRSYDYEACLLGMVNDDLDPNGQMNVWLSGGASHQWNPNQKQPATAWEAEIDRLMLAQSIELKPAARKADFDRVQQIVAEEAPFLYLVNKNALAAFRKSVGNASPSPFYPQAFWNADQLYLAEPRR